MKDGNFVFDSIDELHYKYNKLCLNDPGSNMDSPDWIKKTKRQQ